MKKIIIIICTFFLLYQGFSQTESDIKKYYAIIDFIVNNELLIQSYCNDISQYKFEAKNLIISKEKERMHLNRELSYKIFNDNFKKITYEEFNYNGIYLLEIYKDQYYKDSISGGSFKDSIFKKLTLYLEKKIKKEGKIENKMKWEIIMTNSYYKYVSVDIAETNNPVGSTLNFIFLFDDKDRIKEVKIQVLMGM